MIAMAAQTFEAEVEARDDRLFVVVPDSVMTALGPRRRPLLAIDVNGYRYTATPAVYGGRTYLGFRREVQVAAGLSAGKRVRVGLELDERPRELTLPSDLERALRADPILAAAFGAISFTRRREFVAWVEAARRDETRRQRIERILTDLRSAAKDP